MGNSVLAVWPTVNMERSEGLAAKWKDQGYDTAVLIEMDHTFSNVDHKLVNTTWQGFPVAVNRACHTFKDQYEVIVIIGDDILPDPNHRANDILEAFLAHFHGSYGIMQPTGDKFGCYDIACISPWIGSDYIDTRPGPYHTGYYHYYSDAELQDVATMYGCFQQRDDLIQYHDHWSRNKLQRPKYLEPALGHYPLDKQLYHTRKRNNFPGA